MAKTGAGTPATPAAPKGSGRMFGNLLFGLVLIGTSFAAAVAALLAVHLILRRSAQRRRKAALAAPAAQEDAVLVFDDEALLEACESGRALLDALPPATSPWAQFSAWATPRFPGFAAAMAGLSGRGTLRLEAEGPHRMVLTADWCDGLARIALHDPLAEGRTVAVDRLSLAAAEQELAQLRRMVEEAPCPIWREEEGGAVIWANPAYLRLAADRGGAAGGLTWPLPPIFGVGPPAGAQPLKPPDAPAATQRRGLNAPAPGGPQWFDCVDLPEPDGTRLGFALPADAAVRAESALRDLVQTLSRTFAHLPVGLAVFDRQRRLQLFNPALSDLTTLSPEFLTARPGFEAFFDALRTRQMIPEPKDYRAWRLSLTEIERAAAQGHYQEMWSLTTGQTYRVTGRPHPDGAVAFLIEDVSAEVSLTRRFRAEIETGQAVLDSLPDAIAVFSTDGVLVMSNTAYAELWGDAPDTVVGEVGVAEALRLWKSLAHPSPHWAQLRTLIGAGGPRRAWEGAIQLHDGRHMTCRLMPLTGGATMIAFRPVAGTVAATPPAPALVELSAPAPSIPAPPRIAGAGPG